MKYFVIAGESSGDLHGGNFLKEILKLDKQANINFWGGDSMEKIAGSPLKHINELAFMGFIEVVKNINTIIKNIKQCKVQINEFKPDALILIDYPGFNLRIAKWAKFKGIKVFYYISPQIWAWKESRINKIKKYVDKMLVILPFEKEFYKKHNFDVDFVGHPLIDEIKKFKSEQNQDIVSTKKIIALLPGSRKQEVKIKLPIMLSIVQKFPQYQFIIAGSNTLSKLFYKKIKGNHKNVSIVFNKTYNLLNSSFAAIVTSGTATLETALFKVPQIVCYKGSLISYYIAKLLIKVRFISLVNLIMDKEVVKELIQKQLDTKNLQKQLKKIIIEKERIKIIEEYKLLEKKLGGEGASKKAAEIVFKNSNN